MKSINANSACGKSMKLTFLTIMLSVFSSVMAATVISNGSDGGGKSSFTTGAIFGGAPHPSSDYDYVVKSGHMIRTPEKVYNGTTEINYDFPGNSLSLGDASTDTTGSCGQFAIKTASLFESAQITVTVEDFRLYNYAYLTMANGNAKCRLAGNITVHALAGSPARFATANETNRIFEVSANVIGGVGTGIKYFEAKEKSEFRMTGDMSGYLGSVETACSGARLVLDCPYAASTTEIGPSDRLTLGSGFSYVGTGSIALPAGTRFEVRYDAEIGTTVPLVLDADHFTLAAGKFELSLNAASLPAPAVYAGKTLPVVKIPLSLRRVTENDFTDVTSGAPLEYGLPNRVVKVETDEDGIQTVSIVTVQYVKLSDAVKTQNPDRSTGRWFISDATLWSDGKVPSKDKDYLVQSETTVYSYLRTPEISGHIETFAGRSLTLAQDLGHKSGWFYVSNFVVKGGAAVGASGNGSAKPWQYVNGTMRLLDTTWDNPADVEVQNSQYMELACDISGEGTLRFLPINNSPAARARILGDNSSFTGQIRLYSDVKDDVTVRAVALEFDSPENLGGALSDFDYRSLGIDRGCTLAPRKPMTLSAANRGIWVDTLGIIEVTNGTFGIEWPIRMTGTIRKTGEGILALGGDVSFGAEGVDDPTGGNNVLEVIAGGIMPLSTNTFARLSIVLGEESRLIADARAGNADVRAYGLLNFDNSITLPSDGKLRVSIVNRPEGDDSYNVALCTVSEETGTALSGNIAVDKISGKTVTLFKESVDVGEKKMVRFSARVTKPGFSVILR